MSERRPVIVVTGGASGIGDGIATLFAETHTVIVADVKGAEEKAAALGNGAIGLTIDVSKEEDCKRMAEAAAALGGADAFVNSAGIFPGRDIPLSEMPLEIWDKIVSVNLTGTFLATKHMSKVVRDGGSIVLIGSRTGRMGSVSGDIAQPSNGHYCCTKAGVLSLVKSFAMELGARRIRVNGIAPGAILTPMTPPAKAAKLPPQVPLNCWGSPEDIAGCARFLCSKDSAYVSGHMLDANGGRSMF